MEASPSILSLIGKLQARADAARAGTSEEEANLFAEKVQELLQEHNLSMSQVEAAGGSTDTKREKVTLGSAVRPWQRTLMGALATGNFCLHQINPSPKQGSPARHYLIGRAINVQVTTNTYNYLVEAMTRALHEAGYVAIVDREKSRGRKYSRDGQSFLEGASQRLAERLEARRAQREAESAAAEAERQRAAGLNGTHRELVLSDVYGSEQDQNNDVLNSYPLGTTATRRRERQEQQARQRAAYEALKTAGTNATEAWYQVYYGATPENAKMYAAEAAKASSRPSRGGRGRGGNWTRGRTSHNSIAYRAGMNAGEAIGLDPQVGQSARKSLTGPRRD